MASALLKPITKAIPPERAWGIWLSRQIVARTMDAFGPSLAQVQIDPVDVRLPDGRRLVGEWVTAEGASSGGGVIYYLHGSGYAMCSARTHRRLTAWLSRLTQKPIFCVDYRIAPEHPFPAAADDARTGWDWLTGQGIAPDRIVVAGDSAGGHLAVDLALQLGNDDSPPPAALVLFSPLLDVTFGLAARRERMRRDPAITAAGAARMVRLYYGDLDPAHPRLSLDVAGSPALPPTLVQAGGAEMLAADAHQLARDIRTAGGTCDLHVFPQQVHVFQALPKVAPVAALAMAEATDFIVAALPAARQEAVSA